MFARRRFCRPQSSCTDAQTSGRGRLRGRPAARSRRGRRDKARAILFSVINATASLNTPTQAIKWDLRPGPVERPPRVALADFELASLWYLPDSFFDEARLPRQRALAAPAPPPRVSGSPGIVIGESRGQPLRVPLDALQRHMAVIGATGSGKSTLIADLALEFWTRARAPRSSIPTAIWQPTSSNASRHGIADRVHVLRLADRAHPRGFNFLERTTPDQAQLVASEFVQLIHDLWPEFTGPKMQHYLRHALLTTFADPAQQTILELIRVLTDDGFRERYRAKIEDPLLASFWATEWPSAAGRENDASIKAVLNKLGAFVSYDSIRDIVGQGKSTIRPRQIMDAADLLVIDCSRVGGDNARLFGAMCISRYYVDAIGRQGTPRDQRRPHFLIVDEVPTFDTEALRRILDEGRKFGLALVVAAQSLRGLGERLRDSVLTNAGVIALISPGPTTSPPSVACTIRSRRTTSLGCNCTIRGTDVRRRWPARGLWRHGPAAARRRSGGGRGDSRPERCPGYGDPAAVREEVRRRSGGDRFTDSSKPANGSDGRTRSMGEARAMATKWHRVGLTRAIPVPRNRAASGFFWQGLLV